MNTSRETKDKMKIGIVIFAYNRSWHLQQVLDGLQKNDIVDKLYIFQDGLKYEDHKTEWEKVKNIINNITWCEKYSYFSNYNKGLARSIVEGIDVVLQDNDAIIVLEDDCVPTSNFVNFMRQCFEKYKENKRVYSVSGYSYPITLKESEYDVYGCGRISSWGWGTWKDRWKIYKKDYELIRKLKMESKSSKNLAMWGRDLEDILVGNVRGLCDSWAVFWALNVISREGICINPYKSLIKNIGLDGSGTNCGITDRFKVEGIDERKQEFCLPDKIDFLDDTIRAFAPFLGSYTAINTDIDCKKKVLVYGVGSYFLNNEKEINENCYIEKFVDKYKNGYFAGKEIIKPNNIREHDFEEILIMIQDKNEADRVAYNIINECGVPKEKIELGIIK